ncbi:Na+/H+ antiporter NhaC family protein [Shouchella hunanensis]|uniref:Na+/H+ antiporter NhaC family protein n=1 Tax=Shouchella hunanensis TaxID=766894 RepID=A0ABY7WB24_9BACI|nr:Na+/H+ antiporter NhaC family protein [Shouchella hunanensis]WDF04676.1 Na+/H+ antiporter NhaC family protein [Shouchella hunanensis]
MDHMGFISLIPPLIAIGLAITTKNVLVSLFTGLFAGVLLLTSGNPITATTETIGEYLFPQLTDSYNAAVLVLLLFIGGFVGLIEKSGGSAALAKRVVRFLDTKAKTQMAAYVGGLTIFFSDLGSPLIVGPIFEKIFDKAKISREKLAWIIDSTASPLAVMIPFIGWGVYIMGLIRQEFDNIGSDMSEFTAFLQAIPFQLYPILAVAIVPFIALTKLDFGPMARAEQRVEKTGELYWKSSRPLRYSEPVDENQKSYAVLIWLPLLTLFVTLFGLLLTHGFPFEPVAGGDFRVALSTAYLFASIVLIGLMVLLKVKRFSEAFELYSKGMQKMVFVLATLVLAWALGTVMSEMGTANYVIELLQDSVPGYLVPAILFLVAVCISLATATSWGTFAIMMPFAIPMAFGLDAHLAVCIGAVLSGGIFGDHCSPISDTTILSSTGAGCDNVDHVKTQFPYALLNGFIAFIVFIFAGITGSSLVFLAALAFMMVAVFLIGKRKPKHVQI